MLCTLIVLLYILIVLFKYFYCNVCIVLGILFHCVVVCTVCVQVCNVLLPPGINPIAVNKYYINCLSVHCITVVHSVDRPHRWQSGGGV